MESDFVFEINRYGHIIITDLKSLLESKSINEDKVALEETVKNTTLAESVVKWNRSKISEGQPILWGTIDAANLAGYRFIYNRTKEEDL